MYTCIVKGGTTSTSADVKREVILPFQPNEAERETGNLIAWQFKKLGSRYLSQGFDGRHTACHVIAIVAAAKLHGSMSEDED